MSCFEDDDGHVLADPLCGYGCKHCDESREQCLACEGVAELGDEYCAACAKELN